MHPRFDAPLRPPVLRRFTRRRRGHAPRQTFLFSGPSQFLGQGLFAAPRQDARVLDRFFSFLLLRLGLPPLADRDAPSSFGLLRLTLAAGRAPRQIHALLNWRRRFYFQSLRRRWGLPSRQRRYLRALHVVVPSTRVVLSVNQPSEQQIGIGVLLLLFGRRRRRRLPLIGSRVVS